VYRRKIENTLIDWKNRPDHKPLIIKGCRQCGKTSSVLAFAKSQYKYVIYLDFHEHKEYKAFFSGALDVDTITLNISSIIVAAKFVAGQTCFIFDEIQDCPNARASLKFFKQDGRFDVICTGSLLGVHGYKSKEELLEEESASIPVGYEQIEIMYPMDFEEWLWANGIEQRHVDYLRKCLEQESPVNAAIHERMRQLLLHYIIVGGMPEVVSTFLATKNIAEAQRVQTGIIDGYKSDMLKYARQEDKARIRECFESIPTQLAKEYKKFQYSTVRKGGRSKDYAGCIQWIEDAGIIRRCYNLTTTELPLDGNAIRDSFKVYMADIGLLTSMLEKGTSASILKGDLRGYKGAIFESLAADILGKMGRKLYYFHKDTGLEIDFFIRYSGECCAFECKSTTGNTKSLRTILSNEEHYHVYHAIKVGDYNVGRNGEILTLPFYMAFLLTEV